MSKLNTLSMKDLAALESDLAAQVRNATREGETLTIVGGNTRGWVGRNVAGQGKAVPSSEKCICSRDLSGVISYEPSELVLRVGAGTCISDLSQLLGEQGQYLAFEPHVLGVDSASTVGGALATAMAGSSRPWNGGVKDHVLGMGVINGKAEVLRFGGQVMKNVAGYDVSRAMVGGLGCFGMITEVSLKVLPVPVQYRYVAHECDLSAALELAQRLDQGMNLCSGFAWFGGVAHIRLAGADQALTEVCQRFGFSSLIVRESDCAGAEFWRGLNSLNHPFFQALPGGSALEDTSLAGSPLMGSPSMGRVESQTENQRDNVRPEVGVWRIVAPAYTNLSDLFDLDDVLVDWAGAQYFVRARYDEMRPIQAQLDARHVHCYSMSHDDIYTLAPMPSVIEGLHVSLKKAFDPNGVFNLGRMAEAF